MKSPNAVMPLATPQLEQSSFAMLEYLDKLRESRSGVNKYSQGSKRECANISHNGYSGCRYNDCSAIKGRTDSSMLCRDRRQRTDA